MQKPWEQKCHDQILLKLPKYDCCCQFIGWAIKNLGYVKRTVEYCDPQTLPPKSTATVYSFHFRIAHLYNHLHNTQQESNNAARTPLAAPSSILTHGSRIWVVVVVSTMMLVFVNDKGVGKYIFPAAAKAKRKIFYTEIPLTFP